MFHYPAETINQVSQLLEQSSRSHGANGISIGDNVLDLNTAMSPVGPIAWALIIHAEAIAKQCGVSEANETNTLPFTCIANPDTPFGNEVIIQPGKYPLSMGFAYLDAALEHAVCLGINSYNYSPKEWDQLSPEQKVIPLEPYIANLQEMWCNEVQERGTLAEKIRARPVLLDREQLQAHCDMGQRQQPSAMLAFPSAR